MALVTAPLLKVALLLAHAMSTYHGFTPPAVPPLPRARLNTAPDFLHWKPHVQIASVAVDKTILCALAVAEAVILLAQWSAPTTLLHLAIDGILSISNSRLASLPLRITPTSVTACLLAIFGGLIRWWCHRTLGRFFIWAVGLREDHKLVTSGPYRIVRHPSYTGALLLIAGNFMLLFSDGSLFVESGLRSTWAGKVVITTVVAHLTWVAAGAVHRTRAEDEMLRKAFGKSWEEWSLKTPYRIIPFLY
ncbi:hypothetical protein OH76DRAFT_1004682 [Lentinus brumalis]|uniref:Protein-S-isoprenylcysteine O-methyltransferase n=1 Tax=Lentinus brumalis TaxID=2498619 RepID=A0A371CYM4_9APHY|nr:hypothetical protein OH76DRAFT_1004682 [Polyporus brumalis]